MGIEALKDSQIKDNVRRYREQARITGGPFSLADLLQEQNRRIKTGELGTIETAYKIIELSQSSEQGLTTYGDLWKAMKPGQPWSAHKSLGEVTNALERVGFYCVKQRLPLIVSLVVNGAKNELTDQAKDNIFNTWKERGFSTTLSRDDFIAEQQAKARLLIQADLAS